MVDLGDLFYVLELPSTMAGGKRRSLLGGRGDFLEPLRVIQFFVSKPFNSISSYLFKQRLKNPWLIFPIYGISYGEGLRYLFGGPGALCP